MRQRRRYQPISHRDHPLSHSVLNETRYCRKHGKRYQLNVVRNGRIEGGGCPLCNPPKPPVEPEGSSK
jgi:hypothetical protein